MDRNNRIYHLDPHLQREVSGRGDQHLFKPRVCAVVYQIEQEKDDLQQNEDGINSITVVTNLILICFHRRQMKME